MKTTTFILYFLFFGIIGYSQVETKIITVDLSKPHKKSITIYTDSLYTALDYSKWLSVKSKDMIAIKLINGNPLKYYYKIDTKNISFFNEEAKVKEAIDEAIDDSTTDIAALKHMPIKIEDILEYNYSLNNSIDYLNIEVETSYEILKQKNVLKEIDLKERILFLNEAKKSYGINHELINHLEKFKGNKKYAVVQENLFKTKEKAEKSIENIINKFYSINFDIYTLPIDIQGKNIDALEFKLRRFDKETKVEDTDFASTPYNIWIKNGLKIDVSAGLFFSSLYDYEFDKRDDLSILGNKIITLKNKGEYDLAFGSMINTYVRMNSWVVPTINFGAALTKNEKLQVLFGGGLILGKQERIIFTAGISMGKVERIADGYQVGGSYNLGDSGTIPTQSEFKFGKFFGITYNLSKVKKISLDKGIE
ncbi:hypothetical protein [Flavobacterium sp. HNIBRBA15423]|uniref:hypothetical protein n=1 Tax=Flavobacterium sp. HNIBRBA15423 TaxID=3458683 RepID=UPI004044F0F8